ncbi:MAG: PTS fructose transporter subunit IIA [Lactobacillales bacterium]|jgi:PTS system mannose-specific IIA component|nr:PTS fructose transporter subunit IIA [Lactobacillales bacterium]
MLGIVIATHGNLSEGLKNSAEVIMGVTQNIATVNLNPGEEVQALGGKILRAIEEVNQGDGVLVLTDLVSASPYNQSVVTTNALCEKLRNQVYVIGGVNLPMLLETINQQILATPVEEIPPFVLTTGVNSLQVWHVSMVDEDDDEDDF